MKIIVAVFYPFLFPLLLLSFSLCPVFLTGLDVVILDEAIIVFIYPTWTPSRYSHSTHDTVREGRFLPAILADPVGLLEQGMSVAGQETMEEAELDSHHDEE